jgi:hypothetical protein
LVNIAEGAGLTAKTEDGDDKTKRYIIETTGLKPPAAVGLAKNSQFLGWGTPLVDIDCRY